MDVFRKGRNDDEPAFTLRPAIPGLKGIVIGIAVLMIGAVICFLCCYASRALKLGTSAWKSIWRASSAAALEIPIRTGWVLYSPLTTQIIEFPTYVQTVKWTRDTNEGHPINEEMGFNSKEGMEIFVDVSLSYAIEPSKVPDFYT